MFNRNEIKGSSGNSSVVKKRFTLQGLTLFLGILIVITGFAISVQIMLESFWWTRYAESLSPPRNVSDQERLLREKLDFYSKNADEMKSLATLLVGLSTIYGLSLGVGSYLNVKEAKDQFEAQRTELRATVEEELLAIRRDFPLFRATHRAIQDISFSLERLIPDTDFGRDVFQKIDLQDRTMIEYYERSLGTLEFFDLAPFRRDAASIYHMLGSYYSHRFSRERSEYEKVKNNNSQSTSDAENPKPPDPGDIFRSRLYLNRACEISPTIIGPLNELGYLEIIVRSDWLRAVPALRKSLELQDDQQRARYYLAIAEHLQGNEARPQDVIRAEKHYRESVSLLGDALARKRWQKVEEPARYRRAMHYNRACGLARLAELERNPRHIVKFREAAMADLLQTFPAGEVPDEQRKVDFEQDLERGGDLRKLAEAPDFYDVIRTLHARVVKS
ncbi:MAG TPA: hypothetical protein VK525_17860 [Candidatus Saccharimonadales bacterium]|nr:hypothetical protein [Candidatus Saccharimonadales bacterium]